MRIAICDDNVELVQNLSKCLKDKYGPKIQEIDRYYDSDEFVKSVTWEEGKIPDILIMDICFKDGDESGIYAAQEIQGRYPNLKIIFITGYIQYVPDIFMTKPSFLLMKPIKKEKLFLALERTMKDLDETEQKYIKVKTKTGVIPIHPQKIIYIESRKHNLFLYFEDDVEEIRMKMDDFIKLLPDNFIRVHQSFTVNAAYVKKITTEGAFLISEDELPVSRARYAETKKQLSKYLHISDEIK
ncbi:MAG: response regulator transcription factor [Lachnospiraceae bacterium]|nr:response regulator transcription factor [Lachnospiraceae bacterium]